MATSKNVPEIHKPATKKKSSKGSNSSSSTEPILRETSQILSLNSIDYDELIHVMIEFISQHPIVVPVTKTPDPQLPLSILHKAFERIKIENDIIETKLIGDKIVPMHKKTFLKAIGIPKNPKAFHIQ